MPWRRFVWRRDLVDKVLVLCPSLTIEEGLKNKFEKLASDHTLKKIIEETGAVHKNPQSRVQMIRYWTEISAWKTSMPPMRGPVRR